MEARLAHLAVVLAALLSLGASYRTDNFMVSASSPRLAQEVAEAAETFRHDLAVEWLGEQLPTWPEPCPIQVMAEPGMPAGGETSFMFTNGQPHDWRMIIQGSRERVLDSVLPHEVTHTIFATHYGRPLPRWADEGACTTMEHASERRKQDAFLIQFLTTDRGIPFNRMFAMTEYPHDILPLYSQGYSLARFLIAQGGRQKFVQYVGDGMQQNNWTAATRKHYGFKSLSELQVTWLDWVRRGSPALSKPSDVVLASHTTEQPRPAAETASNDLVPLPPIDALAALPTPKTPRRQAGTRNVATQRNVTSGWYARQRDLAYAARAGRGDSSVRADQNNLIADARQPQLQQAEQTILESSAAAPVSEMADERGSESYDTTVRRN